jgi:hypothetical protein
MSALAIFLLILILFGGIGTFPRSGSYSGEWGFAPFGGIIGLLLVLLLLHLLGVF